MHVYGVSAYYAWTGNQLRAELFEMNMKIEQGLDFVVDNSRQLFINAQEAKKVNERTVVRWI